VPKFEEFVCNGELLLTLTDADLEKELKMASGLTRRRMLLEIEKLKKPPTA